MLNPDATIRQYPFVVLLILWINGILLCSQWFQKASGVLWIALSIITLIVVGLGIEIFAKNKRRVAWILFLPFLFLSATNTFYQKPESNPQWIGNITSGAEVYTVEIAEPPEEKAKTILLPSIVTKVRLKDGWQTATGKINLYVFKSEQDFDFQQGDILLLPAEKLAPITHSNNPFSFNFAAYAKLKGVAHQAFLSAADLKFVTHRSITESIIEITKTKLHDGIWKNVKDSTTASLIAATLLNERSTLSDELFQAYSVTGIVHIIAISGMHIVMLSGIILLITKIVPGRRFKIAVYILAAIFVWFYIAITGFPASAVRAGVMFSVLAFGFMINKQGTTINTWAATGFFLLIYNPNWLYDVGAQLSFLAVLSILLFYQPIKRWLSPSNWLLMKLWEVVVVSIAAQILVFPLVIFYFHQFPVWGVLANIPAALFSMVLMVGSLLLFAIHLFGGSCIWLGDTLSLITRMFHQIVVVLSNHTPAQFRALFIDTFQYWLIMLAITAFSLFFFSKKLLFLQTGLICFIFLISDLIIRDQIAIKQNRIVVYQSSQMGLTDIFNGKETIHTFDPAQPKAQQISNPAMLGYRSIGQQLIDSSSQLFFVGNTKVLLLKSSKVYGTGNYMIDVLVISGTSNYQPEQWYRCFKPKLIVIDGSVARGRALKWQNELIASGADVHNVHQDGAWVYSK